MPNLNTQLSLHDVDISDLNWPCAVYCMRRVGYKGTVREFLGEHIADYEEGKIERGSVLVWDITTWSDSPSWRMGNGAPISRHECVDRHYAVYEGDGFCSDVYFPPSSWHCSVRLYELRECEDAPSGVVVFGG